MPSKRRIKSADHVDTFILLDRSGSMSNQWTEAVSSINAYVDGLRKRKVTGNVMLATFDEAYNGLQFDVVRDQPVRGWESISPSVIFPRGSTPLFDAIAQIVNRAERTMPNKAVMVIMTDGYENASRATTLQTAKGKLDGCRARDWQVVFLGANFDTFQQGVTLGSSHATMLNAVPQAYGATMDMLAGHTQNYLVGGGMRGMSASGAVQFSDTHRATASGQTPFQTVPANDNKKKPKRAAA